MAAAPPPPPPGAGLGDNGGSDDAAAAAFVVEGERTLFRRYQTVTERLVRYPSGRLVSFDIVGHSPSAADADVDAADAAAAAAVAVAATGHPAATEVATATASTDGVVAKVAGWGDANGDVARRAPPPLRRPTAVLPSCASVFVFPFDTATATVTYIREYQPGPAAVMPGFPAGMYEATKHADLAAAAAAELEEEAHLRARRLVPLLLDGQAPAGAPAGMGATDDGSYPPAPLRAVAADKYSRNRYSLFLALDPVVVASPAAADPEEVITIHRGSLADVRRMILGGEMSLPSAFVGLAALDYLRAAGYDTGA